MLRRLIVVTPEPNATQRLATDNFRSNLVGFAHQNMNFSTGLHCIHHCYFAEASSPNGRKSNEMVQRAARAALVLSAVQQLQPKAFERALLSKSVCLPKLWEWPVHRESNAIVSFQEQIDILTETSPNAPGRCEASQSAQLAASRASHSSSCSSSSSLKNVVLCLS